MTAQSIKLPVEMMIASGEAQGLSAIQLFGENTDVDTGVGLPEDIWDYGGAYTYTASGGAPYFISSANGGDTQDIELQILSEDGSGDWNEETVTVTLAGQTKTAITTGSTDDPVRIIKATNVGATNLAGNVYIYEDDTVIAGVPQTASKVRAQISIGNNQTLMGLYTIPSGKRGFLKRFYFSSAGLANSVPVVSWRKRPFGKVFQVKHRIGLDVNGGGEFSYLYDSIPVLEAKTDIKMVCDSVGVNNTQVSAGFDLILQDV